MIRSVSGLHDPCRNQEAEQLRPSRINSTASPFKSLLLLHPTSSPDSNSTFLSFSPLCNPTRAAVPPPHDGASPRHSSLLRRPSPSLSLAPCHLLLTDLS